jgi:hypothetical protein
MMRLECLDPESKLLVLADESIIGPERVRFVVGTFGRRREMRKFAGRSGLPIKMPEYAPMSASPPRRVRGKKVGGR